MRLQHRNPRTIVSAAGARLNVGQSTKQHFLATLRKVFARLSGIKSLGSRADVFWCYRKLLRREPETAAAVSKYLVYRNFRSLVSAFVESEEFRTVVGSGANPKSSGSERLSSTDCVTPAANEALALAEFAAGVIDVASTPTEITLESTSRCNLRCVMCPHAIEAVNRPKHLEPELVRGLERFIKQCQRIQLHGIGEPLASPAFWSNLALLASDSWSEVTTNLTVLDDRRLTELLGSNLKVINVSLDAARTDTYRKIRGFAFERVIGNIRRLLSARNSLSQSLPYLHMNMTLMRTNIEEVVEFVELAAEIGADMVFFGHLNRWSELEMQRYVVARDDWTFDYRKEGLWNFPPLSDEWVRKAQARADDLGLPLRLDFNKEVFFGGTEARVG